MVRTAKDFFKTPVLLSLAALFLINTACSSESNLKGGVQSGKAETVKTADSTPEVPKTATTTSTKPVVTTPVVEEEVVDDVPEEAIKKGSFTVWTVPKDPVPFVDYSIYIQVTLPNNTQNYSINDLEGYLIGTDEYEQSFGRGFKPASFEADLNSAVVQIRVPGSFNQVRDTIRVKSTLLNEEQEIEIVF